MSDGAKYDPPPSVEDFERMRAALRLISALQLRKEVHLGRARNSGIEQGCIYCIAEQGLTGDEADAKELTDELRRIEASRSDKHKEPPK